jgi:hypothetical protein
MGKRPKSLAKSAPVLVAVLASSTAFAKPVALEPLVDARLRYEHVDQDGQSNRADAITIRVRPGVVLTAARWSALVEAEGTLAVREDYNDGTNGKTNFPSKTLS